MLNDTRNVTPVQTIYLLYILEIAHLLHLHATKATARHQDQVELLISAEFIILAWPGSGPGTHLVFHRHQQSPAAQCSV